METKQVYQGLKEMTKDQFRPRLQRIRYQIQN